MPIFLNLDSSRSLNAGLDEISTTITLSTLDVKGLGN